MMSARGSFPVVGLLLCALAVSLFVGVRSASAEGSFLFGPKGSEAGQIGGSIGMGIDRATGDVYVGDSGNDRVDKFEAAGKFLLAWGWGVLNGADEAQICTTSCQLGHYGLGAGGFADQSGVAGVAVDSNGPGDPSNGDLYVVDFSNWRVQKFGPNGEFLLMFGEHVNKSGANPNVCLAAEAKECQQGTEGTGNGEFSYGDWRYGKPFIAVGPNGDVYVGDKARVQVFEPNGAWKQNISLVGLTTEGRVTALAVNSAGDLYVKVEGVAGVREFEPGGIEMPTRLDEEAGEAVEAIALDEAGDVFLSEGKATYGEPCTCDFVQYSPSGQELARFGAGTLTGFGSSLAFDDGLNELLVEGSNHSESGIWGFAPPPPGPLMKPGTEQGTPETKGAAVFEAFVNPEGNETTVRVEYVDQAKYSAGGFTGATSTTPASIGSSFNYQHVEVKLPPKTLVPGVAYHYRIVASNSQGTAAGPDQSLQEIPPAYVDGPWAANAASTSVTLAAMINPLGASTTYRLEYGASPSYGHVFTGDVGEGMSFVQIGYHVQELEPHTTYHYRLVTESEVGIVEGADHTFTTQIVSSELVLPDGRAWELVSPADKKGALIEPSAFNSRIQAASGGGAITYYSLGPHVGENLQGLTGYTQVLSRRGPAGWSTEDISLPTRRTLNGENQTGGIAIFGGGGNYPIFSPDLSLAAVEPTPFLTPTLSPQATERTLYLRDTAAGTFLPLVTPANVPPGTQFGGMPSEAETTVTSETAITSTDLAMGFVVATPDLSHVVLHSPLKLTPDAVSVLVEECTKEGIERYTCGIPNLYEWSAGRLALVNILPDGKPTQGPLSPALAGGADDPISPYEEGTLTRAISADGRWVAWTESGVVQGFAKFGGLYLRDMVAGKTIKIGGAHPIYQTMSADGSRAFFLEDGELYELDTATGTQSDLTAHHGSGESSAGVKQAVIGTSQDGSYVYFVASGVLAAGATSGEDNVYLLHEGGSGWSTRYIATLSSADEKSWFGADGSIGADGSRDLVSTLVDSRVTADGRYLAFMSSRSLTGYDNRDAISGQPDEEVYLYDALRDRLACASCNPTGARPLGVLENSFFPLVDYIESWRGHWLAANVPGWEGQLRANYQPHYLLEDGRVLFNSSDALVPQDTNGLEDVYEYEPVGVGDCTGESATFSERADGCVNLISSGQSAANSIFRRIREA